MSKTLYTNQFIYLFRSRHYNHAKAYGLSGENGSSATKEVLETFGYDTPQVDARFDYCYFAGPVKDLEGNQILLDDGVTPLVYEPWNVALDVSGKPYEKTAGARMKNTKSIRRGLRTENCWTMTSCCSATPTCCSCKVRLRCGMGKMAMPS